MQLCLYFGYNASMKLASVVLLVCSCAFATNYYVSSLHGKSANNGLSSQAPWPGLSWVHERDLLPGDSVLIEAGSDVTGPFFIVSAGTADRPIVVTRYAEGADPVIRYTGDWSNGIEIRGDKGAAYVNVDHLEFRDAQEAGVNVRHDAHHVIIRYCKFRKTGYGVVLHGDSNEVAFSDFAELNMVRNTEGVAGSSAADDDYGAVGVEIEGSNNRVYNNSFVGLRAPSFDYGYDGGAVEFYGEADSNEIFANRADHCNGFMEIGGGSAKGNRVHHNLMVDNFLSTAWFHLEGTFASQVEDFRIEHNTIVFRNPEPWSYILGFKGVASENTVVFRNNLVLSAAPFSNSDFMTRTSNIYVPIGIVWDAPGETETSDAMLADTAAGDWRPLPGSVAIGAAMMLPYVNDAAGLAYGASRDVGAYQHVGYTALRNPRPQPKPVTTSVRWWNLLGRTSTIWHP